MKTNINRILETTIDDGGQTLKVVIIIIIIGKMYALNEITCHIVIFIYVCIVGIYFW